MTNARREAELSRKSNRTEMVPMYADVYDGEGNRVSARYLGHTRVLNRQIQRMPPRFNTLLASVSKIDLTRAPRAVQAWWARL